MIRRPPRSTLSPTRRSSDLPPLPHRLHQRRVGVADEVPERGRSEEHTSELQSPCNLVCRLLLEKKKHAHGATFVEPVTRSSEPAASSFAPNGHQHMCDARSP